MQIYKHKPWDYTDTDTDFKVEEGSCGDFDDMLFEEEVAVKNNSWWMCKEGDRVEL